MIFKAITRLVFATTLVNLFPVDAGYYQWQADAAVDIDRPAWSSQELRLAMEVLPEAQARYDAPVKVDTDSFGIVTSARSALVVDRDSGAILFAKQPDQLRAIGSVTKLMSALVFLDTEPDLSQYVTLDPKQDYVGGGRHYVAFYEPVLLEDVLAASLVGSDNTATQSLARFSGLDIEDFIARMNEKAVELEMTNSMFADPTGVDPDNLSTARDLVTLLEVADENEIIKSFMQSSSTTLSQSGNSITVNNTNVLLTSFLNNGNYDVLGGKTGFLPEAGYVLATTVQEGDHAVHVIVMGAESKDARADEAKGLAAWAFKTFSWDE